LEDIDHIVGEESLKLYIATWTRGYICDWNKVNLEWDKTLMTVALMKFENLDNLLNYEYKVGYFVKNLTFSGF